MTYLSRLIWEDVNSSSESLRNLVQFLVFPPLLSFLDRQRWIKGWTGRLSGTSIDRASFFTTAFFPHYIVQLDHCCGKFILWAVKTLAPALEAGLPLAVESFHCFVTFKIYKSLGFPEQSSLSECIQDQNGILLGQVSFLFSFSNYYIYFHDN